MPHSSPNSSFAAGQVWRFHTRPGEEGARIAVLAVREDAGLGTICSIAIGGVRIPNPHVPGGIQEVLAHAPVTATVLATAVTDLEALDGPRAGHPDYADSYGQWLDLFEREEAGVFTISPAAILDLIEQSIAGGPAS